MSFLFKKTRLPTAAEALPGRAEPILTEGQHYVTGHPLFPPFPPHLDRAVFGLGCFWGAERKFWQQPGVYSTAVGYAGGLTPHPSYAEVCTGLTGHTEAVLVIFDPVQISYQELLAVFWEAHDPTQAMRQGNDVGTQYRSAIYTDNDGQQQTAELTKQQYQTRLDAAGFGEICTEILEAVKFYYAEAEHQQYLAKNPQGYCGLGGLGVSFCS